MSALLEDRWGKAGGATIWATCGTKMLLPGISDPETLESVSRLCGTVASGRNDDDKLVRVVPPELLRALPDWRALIIRMNLSPVVVKVRPVWKRPGRRFPLRYFRQPRPGVFSGAVLPEAVEDLPGYDSKPEPAGAADDLIAVPAQRADAWPWEEDNTGPGAQE